MGEGINILGLNIEVLIAEDKSRACNYREFYWLKSIYDVDIMIQSRAHVMLCLSNADFSAPVLVNIRKVSESFV